MFKMHCIPQRVSLVTAMFVGTALSATARSESFRIVIAGLSQTDGGRRFEVDVPASSVQIVIFQTVK
jgi:hypothetical protein